VTGRVVMTADDVGRAIARLAGDVVDRTDGTGRLALVGIQRRGAILAERLAAAIEAREGVRPPVGTLDISLYRDDLSELAAYPIVRPTVLPFDISGRPLVLVDDVLFTGRTVRAALDALADHGRPRRIGLAVLVDRGHRELPIRADHVGRNLPTAFDERVSVRVVELDGVDEVSLGRSLSQRGGAAATPAPD
jgi:pyrimidine operon attenuation protein/uracil phosphoribosyltransferase